ncbi:hypothetical protein HPB50_002585 [Hyalomma asiaticum]|uniref:Uncharacterized protein n=1 Tax=Hyalomma asiaticum TaxID=266040 RepID=A0ACB7SBD1_HYAAI|nr:hypothetical protein HPB50_002585 [Hyalomma asiaticum]
MRPDNACVSFTRAHGLVPAACSSAQNLACRSNGSNTRSLRPSRRPLPFVHLHGSRGIATDTPPFAIGAKRAPGASAHGCSRKRRECSGASRLTAAHSGEDDDRPSVRTDIRTQEHAPEATLRDGCGTPTFLFTTGRAVSPRSANELLRDDTECSGEYPDFTNASEIVVRATRRKRIKGHPP